MTDDTKTSTSSSTASSSSILARNPMTNVRFAVEIFYDTSHFGMWQSEVLDALFQQSLDIAIEGDKPDDVEEKEWKRINRLACGTIRSCLSREQKYAFSKKLLQVNCEGTGGEIFEEKRSEQTLHEKEIVPLQLYKDLALMLMGSLPDELEYLETTLLHGKGIRKRNNVYYFLGSIIVGTAAVVASTDEQESEATRLWHMHLGHVERMNRTLVEKVRYMLSNARLGKEFWAEALVYACHLINRLPSTATGGKTPLEKWFGEPATDYDSLHVFGSTAYYHVKESKLDPRETKVIFMGITSGVKGYRLWCPETKKIIFSRDVTFDESTMLRKVTSEKLEQIDRIPKQVEFEGSRIVPANKETDVDSPIVEEESDEEENFVGFGSAVGFGTSSHGDLDEEIYMTQPDGFKVAEKEKMTEIVKLKTQLNKEFEMKDLGEAKKILGMEISRDKKLWRLCLSQKEYLRKVLKRFGMNKKSKLVSTPLAPHFKLDASMSPKDDAEWEYMSKVPYTSVVGSLMYAMVCTRPDISQVVGVVSRYMHDPGKEHWQAVKWILRYILNTIDVGLVFQQDKQDGQCVVGYCDSDYAEAEYMAVTEAVKEAIWFQGFLGELGMEHKHIKVHCDSQSVIHLAKNQVYHARTKHIDVRYHFVREILEEGNPLSILDGVFMAIKDGIDCYPHPSKGATSWMHEVHSVEKDADCVLRAQICGVILVGKANMHELCMGTTGNNPIYGWILLRSSSNHSFWTMICCPWNRWRFCPHSFISLRRCGLENNLWTDEHGRISSCSIGCITDNWSVCDSGTVEIIGPIASTVEDVILVYAAILGSSPGDRICLRPPPPCFPDLTSLENATTLGSLRLGKYTEWFNDVNSTDISDACEDVLNLLSKNHGCETIEIVIPELNEMRAAHIVAIGSETLCSLNPDCEDGKGVKLTYDTRTSMALLRSFTASDYVAAQCLRLNGNDGYALKDGETDADYLMRFILAGNLLGLPAITVPQVICNSFLTNNSKMHGQHFTANPLALQESSI
ncbi:putative sphingolipid transporter spinster-like protein 2-like [Hibiscus syriacus]|uniref:Sphingolipid transporter spinster-like protein 2-like n=1 Tax=Hibiscus syriacus TaxID=106335 RepID=A0A6A3AUK7_HIBSY|nr:putative sphingolipid transporter spinster-like protein 2-like [Hibiscus syriacus]